MSRWFSGIPWTYPWGGDQGLFIRNLGTGCSIILNASDLSAVGGRYIAYAPDVGRSGDSRINLLQKFRYEAGSCTRNLWLSKRGGP